MSQQLCSKWSCLKNHELVIKRGRQLRAQVAQHVSKQLHQLYHDTLWSLVMQVVKGSSIVSRVACAMLDSD